MRIKVENFKGMAPRVQPRLLPPGFAQVATNTILETGSVRALREALTTYSFGDYRAAFIRHNDAWYGWDNKDVCAVPGPVAQDRIYITGDGVPKLQYLGDVYPLALPAPTSAPAVAFTNLPSDPVPDDPDDPVTLPTGGGTVPAALVIVRQPVGSISGYVLQTQPAVAVVDADGLLCDTDDATEVTVSIASGVFGALLGTRIVTAVDGYVKFTDLELAGDDETDYRLRFEAGEFEPVDSEIVTVTENFETLTSSVLYAYTYVTSLGEESAPSALSESLDWYPGLIVRLSSFAAAPAGRLINAMRIYRTQTSAAGVTDLYFVAEIAHDATTYDHDIDAAPIAEVIPSVDYDTPPDDMDGIIALPNGMMAAFAGRELLFSEPYKPHAWPTKYRLTTDFDIVGLGAFGASVAVLTQGTPYLATGSSPASMIMERLELNYPCVSRRGIVDLGYSIAYPSVDGLVTIGPGGASIATKTLLTRDLWRALSPASFVASQFAGRYVASFGIPGVLVDENGYVYVDESGNPIEAPGQTAKGVVIFDLTGEAPFLVTTDEDLVAMHYSVEDGALFVIENADPGVVKEWDAGAAKTFTWRSGIARTGQLQNFGACLISADNGYDTTATLKVYADGALVATVTTKNMPSRLPSGFLADEWMFEITGTAEIYSVTLATTMEELTNE